jgi:hypothetical protein
MENRKATPKSGAQLRAWTDLNPLRPAEYRYVNEHGAEHLYLLVEMLFEELFPASQQASSKAPGGQ